jgi:hypothetical protein
MLGLRQNRTTFAPGDEIAGAANWELDAPPKSAEVRLCWFTRGKGSEDAAIVETIAFDDPQAGDTRTFSFEAPAAPYSFSGTLISVIWAVELLLQPGDQFERIEITIAPDGEEVLLLKGARKKRAKG